MERPFYEVYEMLYAEYVYESEFRNRRFFLYSEYSILKEMRRTIDAEDKENSLRPDAKYFLLVNFHHLIIKPLFERRYSTEWKSDVEFGGLREDINEDIVTIIRKTKQRSNIQEISGHQIMKTIDENWQNLKVTNRKIWG